MLQVCRKRWYRLCMQEQKKQERKNAKINDEIAVELVKNLDYDFSKADKDKTMNYGVIARTIVLDRMVEQYLKKHENVVVVNLACGLDTRCYRMNGKYLRWYNVDLPETINIRRQFLPETADCDFAAGEFDEILALKVSKHSSDNFPVGTKMISNRLMSDFQLVCSFDRGLF